MAEPVHSTGRGGAGNIGVDQVIYTDGEIVREGPYANEQTSTGRGGAGNVGTSTSTPATTTSGATAQAPRPADDMVPETAVREDHQFEYHTGRGGEGNVHKDKYDGHSSDKRSSIADLGAKIKGFFSSKKSS